MPTKAGSRLLKTRLIRHVKGSWAVAKTDTPSPSFLHSPSPSELAVHLLNGVSTQMVFQRSCTFFLGANKHGGYSRKWHEVYSVNYDFFFCSSFASTLSGCFKSRGKVNWHDPGFELTSVQPRLINVARVPPR